MAPTMSQNFPTIPLNFKTGKTFYPKSLDQCWYLSNWALTPPLTQQQSTDNKLGLMLGEGRGRCEVALVPTLTPAVFPDFVKVCVSDGQIFSLF